MLIDNAPALIHAAADVMNITPEAITGKRKTFAEALARQIVMTLWAESHSLQSACEIVGRIHHTSAVYARAKILSQLQYCENTRERVRKVMQKYSENILDSPVMEVKTNPNVEVRRGHAALPKSSDGL